MYYKGTVEQISLKDPRDGQYGKWCGYGIKLKTSEGEKWLNGVTNQSKTTGAFPVLDKNKNEVMVNMEIECMTEEKGGYENIDKNTLVIRSSGGAAQQPPQAAPQPVQSTQDEHSAISATIYCQCLQSAVTLAKGTTFQAGDKDPVDFTSDMVLRMADVFYKKATSL